MKLIGTFETRMGHDNRLDLTATVMVDEKDMGILQSCLIFAWEQNKDDLSKNIFIGIPHAKGLRNLIWRRFDPQEHDKAIDFVKKVFSEVERQYRLFVDKNSIKPPPPMEHRINDVSCSRFCTCPECR